MNDAVITQFSVICARKGSCQTQLSKEVIGDSLIQGGQNSLVVFPATELLRRKSST
jgi:hypothetical protein